MQRNLKSEAKKEGCLTDSLMEQSRENDVHPWFNCSFQGYFQSPGSQVVSQGA